VIHEYILVLDREPTDAELEVLATAGLDPTGGAPAHAGNRPR
jgi:hypothetical protein